MKWNYHFTFSVDDYLYEQLTSITEYEAIDSCCGASVLKGFSEEVSYKDYLFNWEDKYAEYKSEDLDLKPRKASPDSEKKFLDAIERSIPDIDYSVLSIVILNNHQKVYFPVLEKLGFKIVSDSFINSSTGNKLTMFVYTPKNKRSGR